MAPGGGGGGGGGGRRRGGGKGGGGGEREKRELSIGDLVLAKVKGFPAWPAKISRPEDWDRAPDPKKYFVLFFGTNEIAFVAPADIQAFTSEVKDKLLAKGQAKTHKYFAPAVEDICEEFEQLHHKDSGNLGDFNSDALSVDTDDNALENGLKDGRSIDGLSRETDDTRSSNSCKAGEISSPLKSHERKTKKNKPLDDEANSQKEVILALSCSKEDDQIDVEREVRKDFSSVKTSLYRETDGGKKAQMNGQKTGQTTTMSKKKPKECHNVHKNGVSTTASSKPRDNSVNDKVGKLTTSSSIRESYKERKQDIEITNEKKKELKKHRKSLDEADFPPTKRRREDSESLSKSVIKTGENKTRKLLAEKKNDELHGSTAKLPVTQLHAKRRAVRMYDDDDDERPKTPVHGRTVSKGSDSVGLKKKEITESNSVKVPNEHSRLKSDELLDKRVKKVIAGSTPHSNTKAIERVTIKKDKLILGSPGKSPMTGGDGKRQVLEPKKTDLTEKKLQTGLSKGPDFILDGLGNTQNIVKSEKSKIISSGQSRNIEGISTQCTHDTDTVRVDSANDNSFSGGRMEASADDGTKHFFGSKISESSSSMRTLIAAAQASRKQAVSHNNNSHHGENNTLSTPSIEQPRRSESPLLPPDPERDYLNTFKMSSQQDLLSDKKPDNEEFEERRVEDTEAAVARDAFEGMIETLSRTRDSIGRATRLAIDCAKYGIANEVVELLIRKLETEPDDHRKIDLFFLVDSITQGSHKGIAGSSYIPAVEAALPRLIGAAAPRGPSAHENRRQCLKVLKLWMERNILPESLLRRYIDGLGIPNEDNFMLKRPSRAERAVDDPIREMEGMLVDEYGSNVTSQLPGLLSANIFEDDEDDEPEPSYAEPDIESPLEKQPVTLDSETCVTPSDRTNCILKDVDGELEMEDVSVQPKDEPFSCGNGSVNDEYMETCSEEVSPLHGSPPLPLYSPPSTPPLPSSPPPSPSPPPPPSSLLSLPQSLPVPPSGPPQPSFSPPMISQQFHLPPSSIPNVSPNLSYQQPPPLENCSTPSGNQFVQIPPSTTFRHNDLHVNSQAPQQNQHFQTRTSNPQFPQRPFHPIPPPMSQASHYVYHNPPANQPPHHPYPRPYSSPNLHDGPRRYIADEQWRRPANEFKRENSRGAWMGKGGTGAPYGHEGHFSSPFERQAMNKGGFHPATPIPGHAVSPPLPFRPDMPHIDRWRP